MSSIEQAWIPAWGKPCRRSNIGKQLHQFTLTEASEAQQQTQGHWLRLSRRCGCQEGSEKQQRAEALFQFCRFCTNCDTNRHDSLPHTWPGHFPSPFTSGCSTLLLRHCRAGLGNLQRTKTVSKNAPEMVHLCESPSKTPALLWHLGRSVRADANSEGLEKAQRKSHIHTTSWTIYYPERQRGVLECL